MKILLHLAAFFALSCTAIGALAQPPVEPKVDITKVPSAAQPSPNFNAEAATEAYMAMIPQQATARSNAYFEGGYWLILWGFLYGAAVSVLLLATGLSTRMRLLANRVTRFRGLRTFLYWLQFVLVTTVAGFPLEYYQNFVREHQYGLATQTFGPWMWDEAKGLLLQMILGGLAVTALFAIVRRLPRTWWIWGAAASIVFLVIGVAIGPVFLQPMFNTPKKLEDQTIKASILRLAHANGIPTNDVYQIDASKQTTRMSANVSGFAGTMRITLNDNLIRRGSPEEIQAVMGHEMGHYILNHIFSSIIFLILVMTVFFAFLRWSLDWALGRWGGRWGIEGVDDPAVLPLVMLLASVVFYVLTPVMNTQTRMQEKEADMFGINASRQPDGFAQAAIHLSEYRKMRPGKWEEIIFFDHPSGYDRIHSSMVWKGQNLQLFPKIDAKEVTGGLLP